MTNKWYISDTHFNHANILTFRHGDNGPLIRPGFSSVEDMNETMIDNWNRVVKPGDKVYHLGDVAFGDVQDFHNIMRRLNGRKTLIMGNHDKFDTLDYAMHFKSICSWKPFKDKKSKPKADKFIPFICCHYVLHQDNLYGRDGVVFNVHGHIHEREVMQNRGNVIDPAYINVCVEKRNYTPVHFDELQQIMKQRNIW